MTRFLTGTRFWGKVEKTDACWIWKSGLFTNGYGQFWDGSRRVRAHRWAYEALIGPIPPGLVLDHLCRVRHCVNPAHLEPVTNQENVLRGETIVAANAQRTHCPSGHPYDEKNTHQNKRGSRCCRACAAIAAGARRAAKKALA